MRAVCVRRVLFPARARAALAPGSTTLILFCAAVARDLASEPCWAWLGGRFAVMWRGAGPPVLRGSTPSDRDSRRGIVAMGRLEFSGSAYRHGLKTAHAHLRLCVSVLLPSCAPPAALSGLSHRCYHAGCANQRYELHDLQRMVLVCTASGVGLLRGAALSDCTQVKARVCAPTG